MPAYTYFCATCETDFEAVAEREACTNPQPCPMCEQESQRQFGRIGFILKGDGWVGKNQRLKNQMTEKNKRLDEKGKERSRWGSARLRPNVSDGQGNAIEVDSWSEAQKLAKSRGKDTRSYERRVHKEQSGR